MIAYFVLEEKNKTKIKMNIIIIDNTIGLSNMIIIIIEQS